MKVAKLLLTVLIFIFISSCGNKEKTPVKFILKKPQGVEEINIPIDKGFSEYITGYTSGIIPVNSVIEIRFTPEFAAKANRQTPVGLFIFEPAIRGKTEWSDELTLIFRPAKNLDPGTAFSGKLNLDKLAEVKENLKVFPISIRTIKKDFIVTTGALECPPEGNKYSLHGAIAASDYIASSEVESYLQAKLGRKKLEVHWDHSDMHNHKFIVSNIDRTDKVQRLELAWDGTQAGVRQKGSTLVKIPPSGDFSVIDVIENQGGGQSIDIVFSDPVDASQEIPGLIWLSPRQESLQV
jgi:hypothetical protein